MLPLKHWLIIMDTNILSKRAQSLSGRVLGSRLRGCGLEPHRRHCVVSLSKTHLSLLSTGSTQKDPSQHIRKIVTWCVKNQIKQTKKHYNYELLTSFVDPFYYLISHLSFILYCLVCSLQPFYHLLGKG